MEWHEVEQQADEICLRGELGMHAFLLTVLESVRAEEQEPLA